jgi:hypothetical protein
MVGITEGSEIQAGAGEERGPTIEPMAAVGVAGIRVP